MSENEEDQSESQPDNHSNQSESKQGQEQQVNEPEQQQPQQQDNKALSPPLPPVIYDGYSQDLGIPIQYTLVILLVTAVVFLVYAFQYPEQRAKFMVAVNLWLFEDEIKDMRFDNESFNITVTQYNNENNVVTQLLSKINEKSTYKNRYWEISNIPLSYNMGAANLTTEVKVNYTKYNYTISYNITSRLLPSGVFVANRPHSLVYSAAADPFQRYLSAVPSSAVNNFIGIVSVPLVIYHYKDQRIKTSTADQGSNVPELGLGFTFFAFFVLLLIVALVANVFLNAAAEQAAHVRQMFDAPQQQGEELAVKEKPVFKRRYERTGNFAVNKYPPMIPLM